MGIYDGYKIVLFPETNSTAIVPSAETAGNITHFYNQYNDLIDRLSLNLESIANDITFLTALIDGLNNRVGVLEAANQGGGETPNYTIENVDLTDAEDSLLTFVESGTISKILVSGATDIYDIFFSVNEVTLNNDSWDAVTDGYEIPVSGSGTSFASGDFFSAYVGSGTQAGVTLELILV